MMKIIGPPMDPVILQMVLQMSTVLAILTDMVKMVIPMGMNIKMVFLMVKGKSNPCIVLEKIGVNYRFVPSLLKIANFSVDILSLPFYIFWGHS